MEKFRRWMMRRNGIDVLGKDVCCLSLILNLVNLFVRTGYLTVLSEIGFLYSLFRIFSANKVQRGVENYRYLSWKRKITAFFSDRIKALDERKEYRYFRCPNCRQKLRVPRKQGKIEVTCPKCGTKFDSRS